MSEDGPTRTLDMLQQLEDRWMRLLAPFVDHPSYASASFASLIDRYSEEGRYCHTVGHLARVVQLIEDLARLPSSAPDDLVPVELAGFFCHVVHEPRARDDEERSAALAGSWLDGLGVPHEVVTETQRLILLTADHGAPEQDRNAAVLLDAELAIAGEDQKVYDRFLEDLRREHSSTGEDEYVERRRKVLESLLAREHIFRTPLCRNTVEPAARVNLMRELERYQPARDEAPSTGACSTGAGPSPAGDVSWSIEIPRSSEKMVTIGSSPLTRMELRRLSTATPSDPRRRADLHEGAGLRRYVWIGLVTLAMMIVIFVAVQALRPLPSLRVEPALAARVSVPGELALPWPSQGQAAMDVEGSGSLGGVDATASVPVASLTKMMTALVVLEDHPLVAGASGPSITVTPSEVATYQADVATQQSVVQVAAGEQLSELQAVQALLIASGNNVAQMLAVWDAGTESAFVAKMNDKARSLGLQATHYTSPSGLETSNVSSADDEIRLAEAVLENPTVAQVVSEPQVTLPVAGTLYNFDYALGHDGIVGVKTGSSTAAGGCFVFLARQPVAGREVSVVGSVLGQQQGPSPLISALDVSEALVKAAFSSLKPTEVVRRGEVVGRVVSKWGASAPAEAARPVTLVAAPRMEATTRIQGATVGSTVRDGARVGTLEVRAGSQRVTVAVVASGPPAAPSLWWRLRRF